MTSFGKEWEFQVYGRVDTGCGSSCFVLVVVVSLFVLYIPGSKRPKDRVVFSRRMVIDKSQTKVKADSWNIASLSGPSISSRGETKHDWMCLTLQKRRPRRYRDP